MVQSVMAAESRAHGPERKSWPISQVSGMAERWEDDAMAHTYQQLPGHFLGTFLVIFALVVHNGLDPWPCPGGMAALR